MAKSFLNGDCLRRDELFPLHTRQYLEVYNAENNYSQVGQFFLMGGSVSSPLHTIFESFNAENHYNRNLWINKWNGIERKIIQVKSSSLNGDIVKRKHLTKAHPSPTPQTSPGQIPTHPNIAQILQESQVRGKLDL